MEALSLLNTHNDSASSTLGMEKVECKGAKSFGQSVAPVIRRAGTGPQAGAHQSHCLSCRSWLHAKTTPHSPALGDGKLSPEQAREPGSLFTLQEDGV